MKLLNLLFISFLFLQNNHTFCQVVSIDYILNGSVTKVDKVKIPKKDVLVLKTEFGQSNFTVKNVNDSLRGKIIDRIELIYTQYRQSETFAQPLLNEKRLAYLKEQVPYIFNNNLIKWNIVCQTGAATDQEAKKYFHGFIIHFQTKSTTEIKTTKEEIEYIDYLIESSLMKKGDTIKYPGDLCYSGYCKLTPCITIDSIYKIQKGKFKGKYIKITPHSITKVEYFEKKDLKNTFFDHSLIQDTITMVTPFSKSKKLKVEGKFVPRSKSKAKKGITYSKATILKRKPLINKFVIEDTIYLTFKTEYIIEDFDFPVLRREAYDAFINSRGIDTVVISTFNKQKDWKHTMIVEDLTGSMYPYLAQTIMWRRITMASTNLSKFIFFNDGDNKSDFAKVIGEIGGIYTIESDSIIDVEHVAKQCMRGGSGGDGPENNLEALIFANNLHSDCHPLMIADNNAPIKDISLINKITKPVDIILCGVVDGRIQADYLTLSRKVGGTIYTMDDELKDISRLKEGETIIFGGQKFMISSGRFVLVR